jgi:hypothetical protein
MIRAIPTSLALLLAVASIPFATTACDLLKKKDQADAAPATPPAATTAIAPAATPPPAVSVAPLQTAQPAHAAGGAHVAKAADGGAAVATEAGAPALTFTIPTALPSGITLPPIPSGLATAFPSGLPTFQFPTAADAGKK